jgi:hypothetical protein
MSAGAEAPGSWLPFFIHVSIIAQGRGGVTFLGNVIFKG